MGQFIDAPDDIKISHGGKACVANSENHCMQVFHPVYNISAITNY